MKDLDLIIGKPAIAMAAQAAGQNSVQVLFLKFSHLMQLAGSGTVVPVSGGNLSIVGHFVLPKIVRVFELTGVHVLRITEPCVIGWTTAGLMALKVDGICDCPDYEELFLTCDDCDKLFQIFGHLSVIKHMRDGHTLVCALCPPEKVVKFQTHEDVKTHFRENHYNEDKHEHARCTKCGKIIMF